MVSIFGFDLGDVGAELKDIGVTPQTIVQGLGEYGKFSAQQDATDTAKQNQTDLFAHQDAQAAQAQQNQIELLKLKAALGGGGGGGGGVDLRPYYIQQAENARQQQISAAQNGSNLTISAYKNLLDGATRPLLR